MIPGEISLSHNGVLFLDEILEFKKEVLEALRQPLEDKNIKISKAYGSVCYPANFMLVGALNPCPCGYFGSNIRSCTCSEFERNRYIKRLSGPLLDRIDLFCFVNSVPFEDIKNNNTGESSYNIRKRVQNARKIQKNRFSNSKIHCNSQMTDKMINKYCKIDIKCRNMMEKIYKAYNISTRGYNRILKVSRTIADLNERECINSCDIAEALEYRKLIGNI